MPTTLGNPTQPLISLLSLHFSYICICVNKLTVIGSAVNSPPPSQYANTAFFLHFRAYKGHEVGMYRSTHTYAFASSSHIACFPLGRGGTRVRLPPEPEAEKKRSITLAFIAEGPTQVLSRSCGTAQGWFLKKWSRVRLEEMRWEGRWNGELGSEGGFLYLWIYRTSTGKSIVLTTL